VGMLIFSMSKLSLETMFGADVSASDNLLGSYWYGGISKVFAQKFFSAY